MIGKIEVFSIIVFAVIDKEKADPADRFRFLDGTKAKFSAEWNCQAGD